MKATGTSWHAFSLFSLHLFWFWTAVLRSQPPSGPPEAVKAHMKAFTPAVRPRQKSWAKSSPEKVTFWRWSFSHSSADVCVGMCVCDDILGVGQPEALGGRWGIWTSLLARLSVMAASSSINKGWCIHPSCSLASSLSAERMPGVAGPHTHCLSF